MNNSGPSIDPWGTPTLITATNELCCVKLRASETANVLAEQKGQDWNYAKPEEYPWVVSIQEDAEGFAHMCGGSLATAKIVLTACHCIADKPIYRDDGMAFVYKEHRDKVVVAGSVINSREDTTYMKIVSRIDSFRAHPGCRHFMHDEGANDIGGWDNDYGLITLSTKLPIDGKNIATFKLYSMDPFKLKKELMRRMAIRGNCVVVGWGRRVALSSEEFEMLQTKTR
ncbi:Regulatory CLIP domain of proteinases [Nesidiocoris tenuis]|uniref:Regulatory CLIP domain of proteinases n=1 Tax=Nesidiocoris tenuis TaxID=355587 RepID=A0ABN7BAW0_9HEMI|nr:Regulatory CLIP domain of proteinases [Nesidiocoris tenuis]